MSLALHYWMRGVHHCSGPRLRHDLYCVEWDVKLYYTIPYHTAAVSPNFSPLEAYPRLTEMLCSCSVLAMSLSRWLHLDPPPLHCDVTNCFTVDIIIIIIINVQIKVTLNVIRFTESVVEANRQYESQSWRECQRGSSSDLMRQQEHSNDYMDIKGASALGPLWGTVAVGTVAVLFNDVSPCPYPQGLLKDQI